ncbi:DNA polymerase domain-containing protein [Leptospira stimsonii]|uniref:DNA-directed DNA polymerase n=1 Tax=Leptospira stimsonii TaxID=2202203 RepID=A0ABY2N9H9_9LEPT|nr:DNA polymerase domain-containing protein [Leptospira stimsonii]TGK18858.1 DNA polymerase [Leptospira stimsonii]TGM18971.1 DNA polymerase [Leptospira stimsonii]
MKGTFDGYLIDLYDLEDRITLWVKGENELRMFHDSFYPTFYVTGKESYERNFIARLIQLRALLRPPKQIQKLGFYSNKPTSVLEITLSIPSVLRRIYRKLFAFYEKLDIYHSDIELPTAYMYAKNIYPLARVRISYEDQKVIQIEPLTDLKDHDYEIPKLRILNLYFKQNHRIGYSAMNPLIFSTDDGFYEELHFEDLRLLLQRINAIVQELDPDVILTAFGDQAIMPFLFSVSQKYNFKLLFDRDPGRITRKIITKGTSFETYGQVIYRAPNYPLYGRLHIDSSNSFVFKESYLLGIFELARLSRIPIQRMARASTGTALTNIEMAVALKRNYLVPWQKSALEKSKSVYELIRVDMGGLVTLPDIEYGSLLENVAQLDFAQMYPSIMSGYNISPETVNCVCCENDETRTFIPGTTYHICSKRRGVVSEALEDILSRRKFYKDQIESKSARSSVYEARQSALKWMLVTSFGYLGYRNAKFGRLESHESVTAIGREVLLIAKEIAEDHGYTFLHAITDSLFIAKPDFSPLTREELLKLCALISEKTKIQLKIEGIYSWLSFPASKQDQKIGVVNRYFGKFQNGELKVRGVFVRRKDMPLFIKKFQTQILQIMESCHSKAELFEKRSLIDSTYFTYIQSLFSDQIDLKDLLMKRTISKGAEEYVANNSSSQSLNSLTKEGITIEPGEKILYLVVQGWKQKREYLPEEIAVKFVKRPRVHKEYYRGLLIDALEEVTEHLFPRDYFKALRQKQLLLPFRLVS